MSLKLNPPDEDYALSNAYARFHLSNGLVVYDDKDDDKPPFWFRLQDYLTENKLRVNNVVLKFRSNEIHFNLSDSARYLYFCLAAGRDSANDYTDNFYVVGRQVSPTEIECVWYKTPELLEFQTIKKDIKAELETRKLYEMRP